MTMKQRDHDANPHVGGGEERDCRPVKEIDLAERLRKQSPPIDLDRPGQEG
ncbi:MAG TPA: hypothetical protein VKV39_06660 [Candidatus Sulfotelmatobacter sp.]|nr:hypothetical protein [Candidatus Sulfotelmatobacter sp.]